MHRVFVLATLLVLVPLAVGAVEKPTSPVGKKVADFRLKDYRGAEHKLSEMKQPILVVAFLGTECPLAKLYSPRLVQLAEKFDAEKVGFVGINANSQDSITEIAAHARIAKIRFPILKDLGNQVADRMGAVRTPEVFVLDKDRVIRYWGRIDDQYGIGYLRDEPKREDLKIAVEELLAGKPVSVSAIKSVGCHIGRIKQPKAESKVTYSNQIARILQNRCVECHRKGEIAPFALTEYKEVVGWAEMIAEVVDEGRMPPWHASPKHGKFHNDRSLNDDEKKLIFEWVKNGAPEGDPKTLPEPRTFVSGWQLPRKPDTIVELPREVSVQAEGVVRYQYFTVDPKFKEDKWLEAAELLPGNRAVVHHILAFAVPPNSRRIDAVQGYLVGYVPGMRVTPFPKGMAKRIPAGSKIIFQVHYTPIGTPQKDRSKLGLVFADPKTITHEVKTTSSVQRYLRIPPKAENHRVEAWSRRALPECELIGFLPHMHLRGKAFQYEAIFPDGEKEILLDVPRYDFNWQTVYRLAKVRRLPAGTRMHCVAHYDNSENNLSNPDPSKSVRWGDQTWDEMLIGYFDIAVPRVKEEPKNTGDAPTPKKEVPPEIKRRAERLMKVFDKNRDGKVERTEVVKQFQSAFDRMDANGDAMITLEEMIEGLNKR